MKLIFLVNYCYLTDKLQIFVKRFITTLNIIKLTKTQLSNMTQLGGFLGRFLGTLLRIGLPLMKNVIQPLAKSVLIPLRLAAAASAADTGIYKDS